MFNRIDRVVITGASSGIGLDLARRFVAEGSSVVINGRDREKLERLRVGHCRRHDVAAVAIVRMRVGRLDRRGLA